MFSFTKMKSQPFLNEELLLWVVGPSHTEYNLLGDYN